MGEKILIVEDEFVEANDLQNILEKAEYMVSGIARSVAEAEVLIDANPPDIVLIDIFLKGRLTCIDLAKTLSKKNIPFIYLSANSNRTTLDQAKATQPSGFLVKPFREKDILIALEIASYRHNHSKEMRATPRPPATGGQSVVAPGFFGIVGTSNKLLSTLEQVTQVAAYDTSVLILGETGTGKEGLVNVIHQLSARKSNPLVKINCAAIPKTMMESELFGHERGAFTGADERRIGKFEQAQGGTLFLDEIGEIPLDIQSKLLRVLQEKEIERLGGRHTIKIDVRIVAATNRDLHEEVANGRFRMDLYYRLDVFPISLPPLRERKEDIPALVDHFLHKKAVNTGRSVKSVSPKVIQQLLDYSWPGNIRQLEHLIERYLILSKGDVIDTIDLPGELASKLSQPEERVNRQSISEVEKAHILAIIKECNGRISGKGGAAEILQIPVTTLRVKMKKLGIRWEHFFE